MEKSYTGSITGYFLKYLKTKHAVLLEKEYSGNINVKAKIN